MAKIIKGKLTFRTAGDQMIKMPAELEVDSYISKDDISNSIVDTEGTAVTLPSTAVVGTNEAEETTITIPSGDWEALDTNAQDAIKAAYTNVFIVED